MKIKSWIIWIIWIIGSAVFSAHMEYIYNKSWQSILYGALFMIITLIPIGFIIILIELKNNKGINDNS